MYSFCAAIRNAGKTAPQQSNKMAYRPVILTFHNQVAHAASQLSSLIIGLAVWLNN
jgi:hypothetical protein